MCSSKVTLFYGVWVKTYSLASGAKTHKKTAPTLLAIDLSLRRRRTGQQNVKKRAGKRRNATELPEEIWVLIEQAVIDKALEDAEEIALTQNRCKSCTVALGESSAWDVWDLEGSQCKPLSKVWMEWDKPMCEECLDILLEFDDDFCGLDVDEKVLNVVSLSSAPHQSHSALLNKDDVTVSATSALSPLLLSHSNRPQLRSSPPSKPTWEPVTGVIVKNSAVFALDPQALRLPSNAELRLRRLISTYHLQIDDLTEAIVNPPRPPSHTHTPPVNGKAQKKGSRTSAEQSFDKTTPR